MDRGVEYLIEREIIRIYICPSYISPLLLLPLYLPKHFSKDHLFPRVANIYISFSSHESFFLGIISFPPRTFSSTRSPWVYALVLRYNNTGSKPMYRLHDIERNLIIS